MQAIAEALVTTRPERVRLNLNTHSESRLCQVLGAPPQDPRCRAAWCGIAHRIEAALDDPAAAARLDLSKDPVHRLTRGLLEADPASVDHVKSIIARAAGIETEPGLNLADLTAWELVLRTGLKEPRIAHCVRDTDSSSELGL